MSFIAVVKNKSHWNSLILVVIQCSLRKHKLPKYISYINLIWIVIRLTPEKAQWFFKSQVKWCLPSNVLCDSELFLPVQNLVFKMLT